MYNDYSPPPPPPPNSEYPLGPLWFGAPLGPLGTLAPPSGGPTPIGVEIFSTNLHFHNDHQWRPPWALVVMTTLTTRPARPCSNTETHFLYLLLNYHPQKPIGLLHRP